MPGALGTDLTIQISVGEKNTSILLSTPHEKLHPLSSPFEMSRLNALRTTLRQELDVFTRTAHSSFTLQGRDRWERIDQAMRLLRKLGTDLGSSLFRFEDIQDVQQFCRDACGWDDELKDSPRVELVVDDLALAPFEFIPLFSRKSSGRITDALSFQREARSYLGFISVIERTIRPAPKSGSSQNSRQPIPKKGLRLVGDPSLRARIFQFAGLRAVSEVIPSLRKANVSLGQYFPSQALIQAEFESRVGEFLRTATDQIFYFGCHCDTTDVNALNHHFTLSDGSSRRQMDLGAIRRDFYSNGARLKPGPLVFMNACGGASVMPSGVTSFPEIFISNKFLGYIGTESIVPDKTAATFASVFFQNLLGGITLGDSLLAARRHLLDRGNPLGILYTSYASSDLLAMIKR
jgi:hypothetical protein